jgi:hypothetical protein
MKQVDDIQSTKHHLFILLAYFSELSHYFPSRLGANEQQIT